ncbi:beta-carotene 15,15'-monooxygenase [Algoriphagus lacus]|uniref:Probable beta-carotene 15,15'-dioxygenase n=1 Tax=Algoriphagus lacus TaxID=2056311 RepID=A0A418PQD5_9BACT|nr:Brp/Blh family beta-carotene 15,15'-dioxygenase [Algoriphagus lacus]RIW14514.1 beta-carotene 15,15'-monooxygenase [Algoriphagus lacus]
MNRIEFFFKILGAVICLLFISKPEIHLMVEWTLVAVILLTVGIPHGAIDHLLTNPQLERRSFTRFLIHYLLLIAVYSILWYMAPIPALAAFLLMSAYHFGQSHFLAQNQPNHTAWAVYGLRGGYFLAAILCGDLEATQEILAPILEFELSPVSRLLLVAGFGFISGISQLVFGPKFTAIQALELLVLGPTLYFSPLLVGFVVYFGFWHSLPSMLVEYSYLKNLPFCNSLGKFSLQLLPFSVISVIGMGILLSVGTRFLTGQELILMFFVIISLISFPHILYMDKFLKEKNQN